MKLLRFLLITLFLFSCSAQKKFQIVYDQKKSLNYIADKDAKRLKILDKKYILAFQPDKLEYFKIFSGENNWDAIDINGIKIFEVPNEEYKIPSPAYLSENRIRFIENNKIGFRNHKGKIIIPPKFEYAEQFYNDKAVFGEKCINKEKDDEHYVTECQKYGLIDKRGRILKFGDFKYQEITKHIDFR
ncbi:MAG: WG repeat-containing protein [Kaistella sp.]|nr:WG repeat-containing protein [Kaistella sp.]